MDIREMRFSERNIYSGANGLAFLVTFITVAALADIGATFGLVLAAAIVAGLWLTAWSLLVHDLVEAGNRWIGPLVFLATLGCLLAALADSFAMLIGAALLLFSFWLPHMAAESVWQAVPAWAFSPMPAACHR